MPPSAQNGGKASRFQSPLSANFRLTSPEHDRPKVFGMKRVAAFAAVASSFLGAVVPAVHASTTPGWLSAATHLTLNRVFGGARPIETRYISYPQKIAIVFVFDHVVVCEACSAPWNARLPRGRVIRLSYDRRTHHGTGALEFCEARGTSPSRAFCLRR
jgi:hypothetical protein